MELITGIWQFLFDTSSLRSRFMRAVLAVSFGRWRFSAYSSWKSWEVLISRQWLGQWRNWTGCGKRWAMLHVALFSSSSSFSCVNVLLFFFFSLEPRSGGSVPVCHSQSWTKPELCCDAGTGGAVLHSPERDWHHQTPQGKSAMLFFLNFFYLFIFLNK